MSERDLAVAAVAASELEAASMVAVLRDAGIEAAASSNAPSWTGQMSISPTARGASVLVGRDDLERARALLAENRQDSVDIDWDEVDVGERDDDVPLHRVGSMPWLARAAFAVAVILLVLAGLGAIVLVTSG